MAQEISGLRAEIEALKDRALRALAEVENVRKRLERERDEARTIASRGLRATLLHGRRQSHPRARRALAGRRAKADDSLKAVIDGVEATARELSAALARHGVKPIEAAGSALRSEPASGDRRSARPGRASPGPW